jgi:hypothetical protein
MSLRIGFASQRIAPLLAAIVTTGCSALIDTDPAKLGAGPTVPGGGGKCTEPCDDNIECTVDDCDSAGKCRHRPSPEACDDGIGCTEDICNPTRGCVHQESDERCEFCAPGSRCDAKFKGCVGATVLTSCSDDDPCTKDSCVIASASCMSAPLDEDGDGAPAKAVNGISCDDGTDCDDTRASVNPGAQEICNDRDDNCNGRVDDGCIESPDTCSQPARIALNAQGQGMVEGSFGQIEDDFDVSCGSNGRPDAVYRIDLQGTGLVDVVFETMGDSAPLTLAAGSACSNQGFGLGCAQPLEDGRTRLVFHRYDPQEGAQLFLLIDAKDPNEKKDYRVSVKVTSAAPDTCTSTAFDHSACGTLVGFLAGGQGQLAGSCQGFLGRIASEAVLRVAAQKDGRVRIHVSSEEFPPSLYARDSCGALSTELGCKAAQGVTDGEADLTLELGQEFGDEPAYVVVDSGGGIEGQSYTLTCGP